MSTFLTEEQQIERVKDLWKRYGNIILNTGLFLVVLVAGWQFWQSRQLTLHDKASILYREMLVSVMSFEDSGIEAYGKSIMDKFPGTIYADFAELHLARLDIEKAKLDDGIKHLQHVYDTTHSIAIKQIVRIRHARVIAAKKQFDEALTVLDVVDDESFAALIAQTRGDIYLEQGKIQQAREQYQIAMKKSGDSEVFGSLLEMKINHIPQFDRHVVQTQATGANA